MARRHNLARWLDLFGPALVVVAVVGAAGWLVIREMRAAAPWFWPGLGGVALVAVVVSFLRVRARRLSLERALVRLDDHGHLHNRLSAAYAGIGAWPEPREVRDPAEWRWVRLGAPGVVSVGLLAASAWVPLPERTPAGAREQPLAWSQVQSWLDTLAQAKVTDPPALEKLESQLGELRQQPPEQWYQQSSLEAGDNLRRQTEQALQKMGRDLQKAEQVLAESQKLGDHPQPEQLRQLENALSQSMQGLQMGDLPLNKELLKQLKDFQPGQSPQLTPEQMENLRERLKKNEAVCKQCVGPKAGDGEERPRAAGGPGGGGDTAPLSFKKEQSNLHTKETETLSSEDHSQALPADLAGISAGEHQVKKEAAAGPVTGGEIATPGGGGDAVWKNAVLPSERTVLRRFFR